MGGRTNPATSILDDATQGQTSEVAEGDQSLDEILAGDEASNENQAQEEGWWRDPLTPGLRISDEWYATLSPILKFRYRQKVRQEAETTPPTSTGESWDEQSRSTITNPYQEPSPWEVTGLPGGSNTQTYTPQYDNNYARRTMGNMTAGQLAALELQLYQAGYLSNEPGSPLNRQTDIIRGFDHLITNADTGRNDWEDQLDADMVEYQKYLADEEARALAEQKPDPGFVVPAYKKPDYATLAQHVKATMRDQLSRQPTESEMTMLSGYLEQQYRREWQANEVDVERDDWTRRGRAEETGQDQGGTTVPQVDSLARFDEYFTERYDGELSHRKRVDQSEERTQNLFSSFDMLARNMT